MRRVTIRARVSRAHRRRIGNWSLDDVSSLWYFLKYDYYTPLVSLIIAILSGMFLRGQETAVKQAENKWIIARDNVRVKHGGICCCPGATNAFHPESLDRTLPLSYFLQIDVPLNASIIHSRFAARRSRSNGACRHDVHRSFKSWLRIKNFRQSRRLEIIVVRQKRTACFLRTTSFLPPTSMSFPTRRDASTNIPRLAERSNALSTLPKRDSTTNESPNLNHLTLPRNARNSVARLSASAKSRRDDDPLLDARDVVGASDTRTAVPFRRVSRLPSAKTILRPGRWNNTCQ